ncbi:MAG: glycoside hydrolase family 36 protein [Verrucomicrobiae bacterium]|nr:glycoside hydrolase family 36 protein [Verrucomicrobiae bacterium]
MPQPLPDLRLGDTTLRFVSRPGSTVTGWLLFPTDLKDKLARRRESLDHMPEVQEVQKAGLLGKNLPAWNLESMIQIQCAGDSLPPFAPGRSSFGSETSNSFRLVSQRKKQSAQGLTYLTTFKSKLRGLTAIHHLMHPKGQQAFRTFLTVKNTGKNTVRLESVSSFALGGLTPFDKADAPKRLKLHRFRSRWAGEGAHESALLEELHIERSWLGLNLCCERFGNMGTMTLNGFFPFAAIEDTQAGVFWAARIGWPGSWQMQVAKRDDCTHLSGGLADRELGHWFKDLQPGESFTSPWADITCCAGTLDETCQRLTAMSASAVNAQPAVDQDLPVLFNEWCTTWGVPSEKKLLEIADRLKASGSRVRYLVIDAGWFNRDSKTNWGPNGDWIPNKDHYPKGLRHTCEEIRRRGIIPGLWFEMENCGEGTEAYGTKGHFLTRDGHVLVPGKRFWDFRDPWVHDYLTKKVINLMRDCGIGYMKIDYNGTVGLGVDGAESPGEALRQHTEGVQRFVRSIRKALPDLVIETCSSGGHRIDPWFMEACAQGSFSDAHETRDIPIIAANCQRLILPRQSQIWATLRRQDNLHRTVYSLSATFLGRLCLSGEYPALSPEQIRLSREAEDFYRQIAPIIKNGLSRIHGPRILTYRNPKGWQAVMRVDTTGRRALAVIHSFEKPFPRQVRVPLPAGKGWKIRRVFDSQKSKPSLKGLDLICPLEGEYHGIVVELSILTRR